MLFVFSVQVQISKQQSAEGRDLRRETNITNSFPELNKVVNVVVFDQFCAHG